LYQQKQLQSSYLYWQDSQYALRTLQPKDIVNTGIGEKASNLNDVSCICGLDFTLPNGHQVQQIFATHAGRGKFEPISSKDGRCTGWQVRRFY